MATKLKGRGFIDNKLNTRPLAIKNFIAKHGNEQIKKVIICRSPISSTFTKIGEMLTRGDWSKNQEKLGYDSIFHLYLIFELEKITIRMDKNSRVEINNKATLGQDNLFFDNIMPITFGELFDKLEEQNDMVSIYRYDPFSTNCQHFVMMVLSVLNLNTQETQNFVLQKASELVQSEFLKNAAKYVTDFHAVMDHTIRGGKIVKKRSI